MSGKKQKTVKVAKPKDKKYFKKMAIIQLCVGIAIVGFGFLTLIGGFTLIGGGFLVLSASNYLQYKGEVKKEENPSAEPGDSLNHR